jgi:hypothetical protein
MRSQLINAKRAGHDVKVNILPWQLSNTMLTTE